MSFSMMGSNKRLNFLGHKTRAKRVAEKASEVIAQQQEEKRLLMKELAERGKVIQQQQRELNLSVWKKAGRAVKRLFTPKKAG